MRKLLLSILVLVFVSVSIAIANNYDLSQISQARLVTSYSADTTVDQMDTVTFGSYPQSDASGNTKEPIEWIVLDRQGDKAFLLSKYILDCKDYNNHGENCTWETCSLRNWLNSIFYNVAFSNSEKEIILTTNVLNKINEEVYYKRYAPNYRPQIKTVAGNNTFDKVFLLSLDEFDNYFYGFYKEYKTLPGGCNYASNSTGTKYAKLISDLGYHLFVDNYSNDFNGFSPWWLRSPGDFLQNYAMNVDADGIARSYVVSSTLDDRMDDGLYDGYALGVRPAIWVDLSKSYQLNNTTVQNTNTASGTLSTKGNNNKEFNENKIIVTSNEIDGIYYIDEGEDTRIVVNFDVNGSKKIKAATERNLNKYLYVVADNDYTIAVKVEKVVTNGTATVFLPSYYRNENTKTAIEAVHKKQIFAYIAEDANRTPSSSVVGTMTENKNDREVVNDYKNSESGKSNGGRIIGMPTREAELKKDGRFYLNNDMQWDTWVYYKTYYYYVDGSGNILKNLWIELRYVGEDGRMYRGRQTPDGHWVGDDGLVVDIHQDLYNSTLIEAAQSDAWYRTQSGLWYYFENDRTTTKKGWHKDKSDDQWYYLNPETGIMQVGWVNIDGKYYYFNESHNNELNWYETGEGFFDSYNKKVKAYGSMFKNEKTPDGYWVNEKGEYVEKNNQLMTNIIILLGSLFGLIAALVLITVIKIKKNNKAINNNEKT